MSTIDEIIELSKETIRATDEMLPAFERDIRSLLTMKKLLATQRELIAIMTDVLVRVNDYKSSQS